PGLRYRESLSSYALCFSRALIALRLLLSSIPASLPPLLSAGDELPQEVYAPPDVHDPLRLIAPLALHDEGPGVLDRRQRLEELLNSDRPLAERHFLAPVPGFRGRVGVLHVHVDDVRAEHFH